MAMKNLLKIENKIPFIKIKEKCFISIFPITKYDFERFIFEEKYGGINYENYLEEDKRISPKEINNQNIKSIFINKLNISWVKDYIKYIKNKTSSQNIEANLSSQYDLDDLENYINKNLTSIIDDLKKSNNIDSRLSFCVKKNEIKSLMLKNKLFINLPHLISLSPDSPGMAIKKGIEIIPLRGSEDEIIKRRYDCSFRVTLL